MWPEQVGGSAVRALVGRTDARKMERAKRRSSGRLPETARPGPRQPKRGPDSTLAAGRLRAVVEHIEEHLAVFTLAQLAAVAHHSDRFARRCNATG